MAFPSANHIAPQGGGYEPQRTFHFTLEFGGFNEEVALSVQSFSLPTASNTPIELFFGNEKRFVAGQAQFETASLTLVDYVDKDIAGLIEAWRAYVYEPSPEGIFDEGTLFAASNYKVTGDLIEHAPEGTKGGSNRRWRLVGCWPQQVTHGTMDYSSSEVIRIEVVIQYDKAYRIDRPATI